MPDWLGKKLIMTIVGVLVAAFGQKAGLDAPSQQLVVGAIGAYVVGQGVADNGKEKAKIEAKKAP